MAATQLVPTANFTAQTNQNLVSDFMTFNNNSVVWNIVSGGANATVTNATDEKYFGNGSLKLAFTGTAQIEFNSGSKISQSIVPKAGVYFVSFAVKNNNNVDLKVKVFVNGSLFDYNTLYETVVPNSDWNFLYQQINLQKDDVIDFQFTAQSANIGTIMYIDAFKLEFNDKGFFAPTYYLEPFFRNNGFVYLADSLTTPTITIGTSYTQVTIDKLGALTNVLYAPTGVTNGFFVGDNIIPTSIGDDFDGRFDVTITAKTGSPSAIEFIIEIGTGTVGANKAFTGWIQAIGTAPYDQSLPLDFFCLSTFMTNGGKLYMKTDSGTVTISRRNLKLTRKSKGNGV